MAKRTAAEIYQVALAAGFTPAQATTMTAIALGESGGDDADLGDQALQTNTWGPSFGLFQIRTVKGETGKGTDRDIQALAGSDLRQAQAAYRISHNGTDFTPWTVYTRGKYQDFLGQARAAAATLVGGGAAVTPAGDNSGPFPTFGPNWLPWNWPSNAANARYAQLAGGARQIALEVAVVGLGLGLAGYGVTRIASPATDAVRDKLRQGRKVVGQAAAVVL